MNKKFTLLYPIVFALAFLVHDSLNAQVIYNNDVFDTSGAGTTTLTLSNFQIAA